MRTDRKFSKTSLDVLKATELVNKESQRKLSYLETLDILNTADRTLKIDAKRIRLGYVIDAHDRSYEKGTARLASYATILANNQTK